jgi:preprotein translocase subunit YajC
LGSLIVIIAMFALLWLLLIRPQRAKQQQHERLIEGVDVGDEVLSSGGIYGLVRGVDDDKDELHVEIAPGIEVRMDRRAVGAVVRKDEDEAEEEEEEEEERADEADEADGAHEPSAREESVKPVEDSVNAAGSKDSEAAVEPNRR